MTYVFDETSRLRSDGNHVWVGLADPRQEATVGMFGGWTAALLLRAVLSDATGQGSASTLTVHFIKAIMPGSEIKIRTQNIGGGRSLSIWQAEVQVAGTEGVCSDCHRGFVQASRKSQLHGHVHAFGRASRNFGGVSATRQMGTIQHISAQPRFASVQSAGYPVIVLA